MKVQLLSFDGCPHREVAEAHLRAALDAVGSAAEVEHVQVTTQDEAER
jgi:hypothetical protein